MLVVIVLALIISSTTATPLNARLDYLDPILHQEHIQSSNGRYKYGFESNSARAHQVHDADGTSKGFYSYLDDQGMIQHVEYIAGNDGYKVLGGTGSPISPGYTPEVEQARQAHEKAYQEVQNRVLKQQRDELTRASLRPFVSESHVENNNNIPTHHNFVQRNVIPQASISLQSHRSSVTSVFGDDNINLFSGQLKSSSNYNNNYNRVHSFQTVDSTTTSRPIPMQTPTPNYNPAKENKYFVLPPPTVNHYEKIWPLPPIRYKDLEVEVNGQNLYDPTANNINRYKSYNPNFNSSPQNVFAGQQYFPQVPTVPETPIVNTQANIDAIAAKNAFSFIKQKYKFV